MPGGRSGAALPGGARRGGRGEEEQEEEKEEERKSSRRRSRRTRPRRSLRPQDGGGAEGPRGPGRGCGAVAAPEPAAQVRAAGRARLTPAPSPRPDSSPVLVPNLTSSLCPVLPLSPYLCSSTSLISFPSMFLYPFPLPLFLFRISSMFAVSPFPTPFSSLLYPLYSL